MMFDFALRELAQEAREVEGIVVLMVAPDGFYFKTVISGEVAADPEAAGKFLFMQYNDAAVIRRTHGNHKEDNI